VQEEEDQEEEVCMYVCIYYIAFCVYVCMYVYIGSGRGGPWFNTSESKRPGAVKRFKLSPENSQD